MVTSPAKVIERRTAATSVISRPTEVRKPGRRLVRPPLERTEQPHTDTEMPAAEVGSTIEEIKTGTISHATEAPSASTSLLRKRGPSSEPREEPGIQEVAAESSEDTAPPQKKHKETAVSQETMQDTTESTPTPVVPAVPASPEISEVIPELVIPADNVDVPGNAEDMDADQPGGEDIIEATGEDDLTNKDEMDLEEKSQEEEEQQLETDATVIGLEEGEAEQNLPSEGDDDREEGELPEEQDQPQDDIPGEGDNPETTPTRADETEETLEPTSPEPAIEPGEITEERNEGAEIVDEGAKSNEEAPPVVASVVQKSPRRVVRLRGSSSSSVRNNAESSLVGGSAASENQGMASAETEASDVASRGGRTIHLPQRARENAALRQARISQSQTAGRGRGQSPASGRV